jgi:hypothetical protein
MVCSHARSIVDGLMGKCLMLTFMWISCSLSRTYIVQVVGDLAHARYLIP